MIQVRQKRLGNGAVKRGFGGAGRCAEKERLWRTL
jgi:hypothetical protein